MINGLQATPPDLASVLQQVVRKVFESLHAVKIGTIQSFDAAKQTAEVQITFRDVLNDGTSKIVDFPLLSCPVFVLQGGDVSCRMPIKAGDECLVVFVDRNIDIWWQYGKQAVPLDNRRHDLSDGIAIVGLNSLANALVSAVDVAGGEGGLGDATAKVAVKSGKVTVANAGQNLYTILNTLLAALGSDPALSSSTKAAITVAQTALATLLY